MARNRLQFLVESKYVHNKISSYCQFIALHNIGEKKQRIHDRLYLPIKNERIGLMSNLEHKEVWHEILKFPYYPKLDAIDALANVEFELQKIPLMGARDPFLEIGAAFDKFQALEDRPWERITPEEKLKRTLEKISRGKGRVIFDESW